MNDLNPQGGWPVADLKAFLEGRWTISRTINDLRQNVPGAMEGQAWIMPADFEDGTSGLGYREEGQLQLGDYRETFHRSYRYVFAENGSARVLFDDGEPFYEFDLKAGYAAVEHRCAEDMYRGAIRADGADSWRSNWFVSGPAKDIVLDTLYSRIG